MRDLYERLKSKGYPAINELVTGRTQETVQLDFKLKENQNNGDLSKKDRGVLGPALSALANSAGGVLIWGVEAAPDADGLDVAEKAVPIPNLAHFRSDVERAVGELLMPRHDGIEIAAIDDPATTDAGYLAIWVDRSDRRPHRSEAAGDKRYYKRAGNSSFIMEHYDIEDAFNRIAPTELRLCFDAVMDEGTFGSAGETSHIHVLKFLLRNDDRRSACAPYVWVENAFKNNGNVQRTVTGDGGRSTLDQFNYASKQFFSGSGDVYIHPGVAAPAFELRLEFKRQGGLPIINGQRARETAIAFEYGFGCEHARMTTGRFEISGAKLDDLLSGVRPAHFIEDNQPQNN